MKRLLVTGGSGFIGQAVIRSLGSSEYEVHATYMSSDPPESENIQWHKCDLLDPTQQQNLFKNLKPAYLIQLAWCTGQGTYWKDHSNLDWLAANVAIARNFVQNGGVRCVFAGTSAEYDWSGNLPLNEFSTPLIPLQLYGGSKLALYWTLTRFFEQESISFAWVRFFNPFGEGENVLRLIPKTCLRLLKGEKLQFDAALSLRDFLHIDEVGTAVTHVLQSAVTGAVNIGSGKPVSIRKIIESIALNYNRTSQISFAESSQNSSIPDAVTANTTRLTDECGWTSVQPFEHAMNVTCKWWQEWHKKQSV
jgi:nucleoside-diphosphate-sugar epimerase